MNHFKAKMERQMQLLRNQRNLRSERMAREELPYERLVRLSRIQYTGGEELPYERLVGCLEFNTWEINLR